MYSMVDSCTIALYIPMSKEVQASIQWQIKQWYMHTICGTHVQCRNMYIHHMYTYVRVCAMYVHGFFSCLNSHPQGVYRRFICIYVLNGRFLYNSMVYTYVKGGTGEYAVANTVVVYAYNMWYPCTVYVHVYMYTYVQCMCMV